MNKQAVKVRIDKWLWATRFFKTRSLAKAAVEGGKVHYEGARVKASKEVHPGAKLQIRQGWDEKDVKVLGVVEKRVSAQQAALLYEETPASIKRREAAAAQRKALASSTPRPETKPSRKQRQQIRRFNTEDRSQ